jgi:hypothetical protein
MVRRFIGAVNAADGAAKTGLFQGGDDRVYPLNLQGGGFAKRGSTASRRVSPMASPAAPIPTATEQQHQDHDDEDQFHRKPPLMKIFC